MGPLARLLGLTVLAASALVSGAGLGEEGGKESVLRGKEVRLDAPLPSSGLQVNHLRPVGDGIRVGDTVFPVERDGADLRVGTSPAGGAGMATVKEGKTLTLSWTEGGRTRMIPLTFRRTPGGDWSCFNPSAREFTIQKETLLLVDADGDGFYDRDAVDGYAVAGSRILLPMEKDLVLGPWTVSVREVSEDGFTLKVIAAAAEGSPAQVEALAYVNRERGRHGLPPVVLNPALSRGCTAHAEYLRANRKGRDLLPFFDQEEEVLSLPGATPEGNVAARRSRCAPCSHVFALEKRWRTVFDRFEMANPLLHSAGLSEKPVDISVVDFHEVAASPPPPSPVWRSPCLVPADGSVGFPVEMEGAAIAATRGAEGATERGNPLTAVFLGATPKAADVKATLVRLKQGREIPVPVLSVKPDPEPSWIHGAVPERVLDRKSTYRVTWTWLLEGKPGTASAAFTTE